LHKTVQFTATSISPANTLQRCATSDLSPKLLAIVWPYGPQIMKKQLLRTKKSQTNVKITKKNPMAYHTG